jgi:hypothetical protein
MMNILKNEDLDRYKEFGYLTVGNLKKFIEKYNIPDDALVLIERVEDKYFDGVDISGMRNSEGDVFPEGSKSNGWGVYPKENFWYFSAVEHNKKIESGAYLNKEEYPDINENSDFLKPHSEEELEKSKTQYHPAFCCVKYNDENQLFIDMHY